MSTREPLTDIKRVVDVNQGPTPTGRAEKSASTNSFRTAFSTSASTSSLFNGSFASPAVAAYWRLPVSGRPNAFATGDTSHGSELVPSTAQRRYHPRRRSDQHPEFPERFAPANAIYYFWSWFSKTSCQPGRPRDDFHNFRA